MPVDSKRVRAQVEEALRIRGVPLLSHLPLLDSPSFRDATEVACKVVGSFCIAGLANNADPLLLLEWLGEEKALDVLDLQEHALLQRKSFTDEELNEASWRGESITALCWSIGILEELPWPSDTPDYGALFPFIPPEISIERFLATSELRGAQDLFFNLDMYYNLHAAFRHPELWNDYNRECDLLIEVIEARRQVLEWVCYRSNGWYDLSLDT